MKCLMLQALLWKSARELMDALILCIHHVSKERYWTTLAGRIMPLVVTYPLGCRTAGSEFSLALPSDLYITGGKILFLYIPLYYTVYLYLILLMWFPFTSFSPFMRADIKVTYQNKQLHELEDAYWYLSITMIKEVLCSTGFLAE